MATRLYFPALGTAPIAGVLSPHAHWTVATGIIEGPLVTTKTNTALTTGTSQTKGVTTAPSSRMDRRFISDPMSAQTLSGTFDMVLKCQETNVSLDGWLDVVVYVVSGTGTTIRGVAYAGSTTSVAGAVVGAENEEFTTSMLSRIKVALTLTPVAVQAGDRLVVEVGYRSSGVTASLVGRFQYGDPTATADAALTSGVAGNVSWIEFTANLFAGADVVATPGDTAAGSDSAVPVQTFLRTPGDTAAGSDSAVPVQTFLRTPADTAAGSDSAVPVQTFLRVPADTAGGTDAATFDFFTPSNDVVATPADTAAGSDTATEVQDYLRTGADTAAGSDAATPVQTFDRITSDTAAGADVASPTWDRVAVTGGTGAVVLPTLIGSTAVDDASGILTRNLTVPAGVGPSHLGIIMVGSNTGTAATLSAPGWTSRVGATAVNERWSILTRLGGHTAGDVITVTSSGAQQAHVAAIWLDTAGADLDVIGAPTVRSVSAATCLAAGITLPSPEPVLVISTERTTATGTTVTGVTPAAETTLYFREGAASNSVSHLVTAYDPGAAGLTSDQTVTYNSASTNGGAVQFSLVSVVAGPPADRAGGSDSASAVLTVGGVDRVENPADVADGSDQAITSATRSRAETPADVAGGLDAASGSWGRESAPADTASGADALSVGANRARTPADAADGTDDVQVQRASSGAASIADVAGGTDAVTVDAVRPRTAADVAGGTDAQTGAREIVWADGATGSDTATTAGVRTVSVADTADGSDEASTQRASAGGETVSDQATGSDAVTVSTDRARTAADTAAGSDALVVVRGAGIADTASGADAVTTVPGLPRSSSPTPPTVRTTSRSRRRGPQAGP
jgi:hypothetical protein